MISELSGRLLRRLTGKELQNMADVAAKNNVTYTLTNIIAEMTYREQRRLGTWVAWLIAGALAANILGIISNAVL